MVQWIFYFNIIINQDFISLKQVIYAKMIKISLEFDVAYTAIYRKIFCHKREIIYAL